MNRGVPVIRQRDRLRGRSLPGPHAAERDRVGARRGVWLEPRSPQGDGLRGHLGVVRAVLPAASLKARVPSWYGPEFVPMKLTCTVQAAPTDKVTPEHVSADRPNTNSPVRVSVPT